MLKAFVANYSQHWPYGGYEYITCTLSANTKSEALGLVLTTYPESLPSCWFIEEIDITGLGNIEQHVYSIS